MCLAIPGKILSFDKNEDPLMRCAMVSFGGIKKSINVSMVPQACIDDYILAHVGVAISIIDENEALKTIKYLETFNN